MLARVSYRVESLEPCHVCLCCGDSASPFARGVGLGHHHSTAILAAAARRAMPLFPPSNKIVGFGCMGMTAFYGPAMKDEAGAALLGAVQAAGCIHFDTAEIYQQFEGVLDGTQQYNEALLGLYLSKAASRDSFTVATKFFPALHNGKCDFQTVSDAVDASLARLGLQHVDLYYCHRMPVTVEALEEWMGSMKHIVESGRVKHVGVSEAPAAWLRRAHAIHPLSALQQEWSLLTREPIESELVPTCKELGIAVVAYSPLARNLLAEPMEAAPSDWRANHPRYEEANYQQNRALAAEVAALAASRGVSAATLSIAWVLNKAARLGVTCVPIPGTTSEAHARANLAASAIELSDAEIAQLEALGATCAGARANEDYVSKAVEGKRA